MISRVAMFPDCFDSTNDAKNVIGMLLDVLHHGILLTDFGKKEKWYKFIKEIYKDQLDVKYGGKIISLIIAIQSKGKIIQLPDFGNVITNEREWIETAKHNFEEENLDLLVSGNKYISECKTAIDKCCHVDDVQISDVWVKFKKNDLILHKTPNDLQNVLKTFLSYSKNLKIIDPYFDDSKKCQDSIEIFVKNYRYRLRLGYIRDTIEIHTSNQDNSIDVATFKIRMERMLKKINNEAKHTIKVYIWGNNSGEDKFHDRIILTNIIGIKSTHSFDVKENSQQEVTWSILSKDSHDKHDDNFGQFSKFKLLDTLSVIKI